VCAELLAAQAKRLSARLAALSIVESVDLAVNAIAPRPVQSRTMASPRPPKGPAASRAKLDAELATKRLADHPDYGRDPHSDVLVLAAREAARLAWHLAGWAESMTLLQSWLDKYPEKLATDEFQTTSTMPREGLANSERQEAALVGTEVVRAQDSPLIRELFALSNEVVWSLGLLVRLRDRVVAERNRLNLHRLVDHRGKGEGASPKTMPERSFALALKYFFSGAERPAPDHEVIRLLAIAMQIAPTGDRIDRWKRICDEVSKIEFDPNDISTPVVEALYLYGYAYPLRGEAKVEFPRRVSASDIVRAISSK
jgi:hypothetical protein